MKTEKAVGNACAVRIPPRGGRLPRSRWLGRRVGRAASALPIWLHLPEGVSSYAATIDGMFRLILWITGVVFVIVEALLLFFLFRYRHREGRKAHYTHGNNRLEVIWTIVPGASSASSSRCSPAGPGRTSSSTCPTDALQIDVTGEQFSWTIRYAGADGKMGTPDDIVSLNQLHFPVGKPVVATLRSKDVIHSFFLPEFRVKQDAVPGMSTPDLVRRACARATGRSRAPSSAASATTG